MDERLRICLWMVSGGGLGSVLGGAFGALTAALYAQSGGAAGTGFGRRVADAFARTAKEDISPLRRATITGAADGFVFLGVVGTLAGILVATVGHTDPRWLIHAALGSVLLVGLAAFFGMLAYGMASNGVWAVLWIFAGGLLGSFLAGIVLGADRCLLGTLPGLFVGLIFSFVRGRYAPTFRSPRAGKAIPPHRPDRDAFRKPDFTDED